MKANDSPPIILVSRPALTVVSKRLKRASTLGRLKVAEMTIRLVDDDLMMDIPGASDGVPARGNWPGLLRVTAKVLLLFAKGEPFGDEVQLSYDHGRLTITDGKAKINYPAEWETTSPMRIEIALDASDADYLKVVSRYPLAQVISSGQENAAFAVDQRLQSAVDKVYDAMKPFGISRAELEAALRELIVKRS